MLSRDPTESPVGIINTGAICYLNSVVQLLYSIPSFRSIIKSIDFPSLLHSCSTFESMKRILKSTFLSLQKTFYALDRSRISVDVSSLFESFQWKDEERNEQVETA